MDVIPSIERLSQMFANATAPAFFLGAVAAFVALMTGRLASVRERIFKLEGESDRLSNFQLTRMRLLQRARLLNHAILLTLCSGITATMLLAVLFAEQFIRVGHAFGAAVLFLTANILLGVALQFFAREAWLARSEIAEALARDASG